LISASSSLVAPRRWPLSTCACTYTAAHRLPGHPVALADNLRSRRRAGILQTRGPASAGRTAPSPSDRSSSA
jgi:hypothetical protein